jgi:hypothetical protein
VRVTSHSACPLKASGFSVWIVSARNFVDGLNAEGLPCMHENGLVLTRGVTRDKGIMLLNTNTSLPSSLLLVRIS